MNHDELLQFLQANLSIQLEYKDAGRAYYAGDHELVATIKLGDLDISSSTTYLPNNTTEREY